MNYTSISIRLYVVEFLLIFCVNSNHSTRNNSKPEGHITFFALLIHTLAYPTEGSSDNSIHGFFYPPFGIKSTGMNSPLVSGKNGPDRLCWLWVSDGCAQEISAARCALFEFLEKLADG
jgi:hypothetical protein